MFRSDAVVAPETGPFCCPLLFSVAKVGGPLHVSVWELAPSCITVGLGRVNEEDAVAAEGQDRVGRCRRSRFDSVRVWEQDPMCLAEVLEAAFCVRAPWAAACGAGWVGVVRPEVSNAAEVQQMVARGPCERRFCFFICLECAQANGAGGICWSGWRGVWCAGCRPRGCVFDSTVCRGRGGKIDVQWL